MVRPSAKELTERELEVMHLFWEHGEQTAAEARDRLEDGGRKRAYVTVANLTRILVEKEFLRQLNEDRPYRYVPTRTFDEVSHHLVRDLMKRVFRGSREQLLVRVLEQKKLTTKEHQLLQDVIELKRAK